MTNVVITTIAFISQAHAGQKYGDMDYFFHPVAVANAVTQPTEDEYLAALLHDVIEDTIFSEDDLRGMYSDAVVDIVVLLSKDKTLDYVGNIQRIIDSGNVSAMKVKLADNRINFSGDKSHMSEERRNRLLDQYSSSISMIVDAL